LIICFSKYIRSVVYFLIILIFLLFSLCNLFVLQIEVRNVGYKRKNREFNILDTKAVEIDKIDGTRKIRDYLGIEDLDYELLDSYNIIVEGSSDKIYIENLCRFFGLTVPKIIAANGADNILKYLDFYQSFYQNKNNKPCLLVLFDNDNKGREVYSKIKTNKYSNLRIYKEVLPNFMGESNDESNIQRTNCDWQVEDFVYPHVLCELVNEILKKRNENSNTEFKYIQAKTIETKIKQLAFKQRGILALIENEKNEKNPETGQIINFISSQLPSEQVKQSLANLFQESLQGNKKIITLIQEGDSKYPKVKEFLIRITESHNFIQV
ncbi:hypothetical protein LC612_30440, partial [Nostoc sp. CHAB 5834]|nr:hypothetical protein [Nostoc sp. CHAB 5834]